jgi:molybdopterin synthase catalytic subunit
MTVRLYTETFLPYRALEEYQQSRVTGLAKFGATAIFVGSMRDFNEGDTVLGMTLEYYPGMTEKQLNDIEAEARREWALLDILICHRVGDINPGESIVLVAVWSAHRAEAFAACRYVMEALKSKAPFWKKEKLSSEVSRWVEHNTPG